MWGLGLIAKGVKSIATGNAQQDLGVHSPHLPSAIDRIGRFLYGFSAIWISATWYTAYANTRTAPGSGPSLVLPGVGKASYAPSRDDPSGPTFAGGTGTGSKPSVSPQLTGASGPVRMQLAKVALSQVGQTRYFYRQTRPMPSSILSNPFIGDCSAFVTLVYKTVPGAPDPNGLGFNGQGYTGDEEKQGTPVGAPNIGDLAFWSSPDHVAIVVSLNPVTIVEFGGGNAPIKVTKSAEDRYHQSFVGYRSYV